jgi:hypothetical protein
MSLCLVSIWALSLLIVRLHLRLFQCVSLALLSAFCVCVCVCVCVWMCVCVCVRACTTEEGKNIIHIIRDPLCGARRRYKEEIALGLRILSTSAWPAYSEHWRLSSMIRYAEKARYYDLEWSENPPLKPLWPVRSHAQIQCKIHAAYPESYVLIWTPQDFLCMSTTRLLACHEMQYEDNKKKMLMAWHEMWEDFAIEGCYGGEETAAAEGDCCRQRRLLQIEETVAAGGDCCS